MLAPADKARWEAERAEALKKEQEQRQAEADTAHQKVGCVACSCFVQSAVCGNATALCPMKLAGTLREVQPQPEPCNCDSKRLQHSIQGGPPAGAVELLVCSWVRVRAAWKSFAQPSWLI